MNTPVAENSIFTIYGTAINGYNVNQNTNEIEEQMPIYLKQAHISTYYQDNPWDILTFSHKFGLPTMGGALDGNQPPGYRPGYLLSNHNSNHNSHNSHNSNNSNHARQSHNTNHSRDRNHNHDRNTTTNNNFKKQRESFENTTGENIRWV